MTTTTYQIYTDGKQTCITFENEARAIAIAKRIAPEFETVSVCAECTYSADDKTPLAARTGFWCLFRAHNFGMRFDRGGDYDNDNL